MTGFKMHQQNTYMDTEGTWHDLISLLEVQDLEATPTVPLSWQGPAQADKSMWHLISSASPCFYLCVYLCKLQQSPYLVKFYVLLIALWPCLTWGQRNGGKMVWLAGAAAELLVLSWGDHCLCWGKPSYLWCTGFSRTKSSPQIQWRFPISYLKETIKKQ